MKNIRYIPDERVEVISSMIDASLKPTVYQSLPQDRKDKIARAVERVKSGKVLPASQVFKAISGKLKALGL